MAGSQIPGSTPGWVCADGTQYWQGLDPDMDLDQNQTQNPSQCHGWPVLMGWACGQTPCVLPHSPTWGYGSKQITKYFCSGFPSSCLLPNAFSNMWRGTTGPNPAELMRPLRTRAASEYWAGMASQQKPSRTALGHTPRRISLFADLHQGQTILLLGVNS